MSNPHSHWYEPTILLNIAIKRIFNTPPWANTMISSCLVKTPEKPSGKKYGERVHDCRIMHCTCCLVKNLT